MRVLITAMPGSGKSAVAEELLRRGLRAYDTDAVPEITWWIDAMTGRRATDVGHPIDAARYIWSWDVPALTELLDSEDADAFVCAITANMREVQFDRVFVLEIDLETMLERLRTRTTNTFGKHDAELAHILTAFERWPTARGRADAWPIDATQPLEKVVDEIVAAASS